METSSLALTLYLEWLKEILQERFTGQKHCSLEDLLALHPEPVLPANCTDTLHELLHRNQMSTGERIIFLLSIAPYYIPDFLGKLPPIGGEQRELDPAFSRSAINKNCIPTVATALTILAGENIHKRKESMRLLIAGATLIKNQLIHIAGSTAYDPFTTLRLLPGEHAFQYLLTGEERHPSFSGDFPAILLETGYCWEDLVLPPETLHQVKEIKEWVEFERKLKQEEHEATKFKPGCKCLFHGPPGVGKTLAATLLGKYTEKKVYKIDLSAVVSKYIGETEKNLSAVFDQAAHGNLILFFDEADALFGKRGITKSSNDRYANQEVAYLLQRFENYEGLSILASNFKDNIDTAFFRRFHIIVKFSNPDTDERLKLWKSYLPKGYRYEEKIDMDELASKVDVNGAAIYNVMRRAYMKAVLRNDTVILGQDLLDSIKMEKAKEGKLV